MVKVPCGATRRNVRYCLVIIVVWISTLVIHFVSTGENKVKVETSRIEKELRVVTLPSQRKKDSKIPDIFMETCLNASVHNYKYILQPVYDVTCGVESSEKESSDQRLLNGSPQLSHNRRQLFALFLVHSKADHFRHRQVIRNTWGSVGQRLSRVVFLLGNPHNRSCQSRLKNESDTFGDILQEDFFETYRNITLKAIMALKWAALYCPRAGFVVKVDDDTYVERKRILANIAKSYLPHRNLLLCKPTYDAPVMRKGKYAMPKDLYSAEQWPPFCFGGGWIASIDVIRDLYEVSINTPQVHLDDVYVTGILRMKIGLKINRATLHGRLFCHSQGRPELVRKWWDIETGSVADFKAGEESWLDCFH